jgi:hypothetical protein
MLRTIVPYLLHGATSALLTQRSRAFLFAGGPLACPSLNRAARLNPARRRLRKSTWARDQTAGTRPGHRADQGSGLGQSALVVARLQRYT